LTVDKANYFAFKVDDIEEAHSHINFQSVASDRAAYRLADQFDQDVLGYMSGFTQSAIHGKANTANTTVNGTKAVSTAGSDELLTSMKLDASDFNGGVSGNSIVVKPRTGADSLNTTTANATPMQVIARMSRKLDQQNVDTNGRWLVLDPVFAELLKDEDSRLLNADFGGSGLQNGLIFNNIHGFKVYMSNNLPEVGDGPTSTTSTGSTHYGVLVAGHSTAAATAEQINKTETYRDPDSFADIVRGMHLYGRKILRPEALAQQAQSGSQALRSAPHQPRVQPAIQEPPAPPSILVPIPCKHPSASLRPPKHRKQIARSPPPLYKLRKFARDSP
jgi:hypothetical protein